VALTDNTYEVIIDFCQDEVSFSHHHDNVTDAIQEYCSQMMHAVLADVEPPARHVRKVTLIIRNESDTVLHTIETPEFTCTHEVAVE
jgi:4-aminobutyrate aminotransferase-like enzyme